MFRRSILRAGLASSAVVAGGAGAYALAGARLAPSPFPGLPALPALPGFPARPARPPRPPLAPPLTYVALGASDAAGVGVDSPARDGWVPLLARRLPGPARVVNLGVPGITLRRALDGVLPRAVSAQPDLVTVWLVVNDVLAGVALDRYRADLDRLLAQLRSGTRAQVAVGNLPDPPAALGGVRVPQFVRRTVVAQWNAAIAAAAWAHDAILVDLAARWPLARHPEFIGPDGLHPTAAGYQALAGAFYAALHDAGLV
jgi:lysophospholipase L1-like esterase